MKTMQEMVSVLLVGLGITLLLTSLVMVPQSRLYADDPPDPDPIANDLGCLDCSSKCTAMGNGGATCETYKDDCVDVGFGGCFKECRCKENPTNSKQCWCTLLK